MISVTTRLKVGEKPFLVVTISLGVCLVLLYTLVSMGGKRVTDVQWKRPSSFFTDDTGARAMYLVLQRLLPAIEQWRQPLTLLPAPGEPAVPTTLMVLGPSQPLSVSDAKALDEWIAQGGQLILATHHDWRISKPTLATARAAPPQGHDAAPEATKEPAYLRQHGVKILEHGTTAPPVDTEVPLSLGPYHLAWENDATPYDSLVQQDQRVLVASKRLGKGRLVVIPDAEAFSNRRLRASHNAVWLVQLCTTWGNGRVLIDEFHQGFGTKRGLLSLLGLFLQTPWGWVCAQLVLAGACYVFGPLRRFGRVADPPPLPRHDPLEMLAARGSLFASAKAKRLVVELIHQHLQYRLSKSMGYTISLDDASTRVRLAAKTTALAAHLECYGPRVERALHDLEISERECLHIGQLAAHIAQEFRRS